MSGFWSVSNGQLTSSGTFENNGADPIPANTNLKACIDEIEWETAKPEYGGDQYIKARWTVLDGEYKGRKVFQKLRVNDAEKRDKAIRMLAAIDANCGGRLMASGQTPDDSMLQMALCNHPMVIKVQVYDINDTKGNWVSMVSPISGQSQQPMQQAPQQAAAPQQSQPTPGDIPF